MNKSLSELHRTLSYFVKDVIMSVEELVNSDIGVQIS